MKLNRKQKIRVVIVILGLILATLYPQISDLINSGYKPPPRNPPQRTEGAGGRKPL